MQITNKQLMEISASLSYLSSMDTPAWYHVGRNIKRLEAPIAELNSAKESIVTKFIKKDEDGQPIYIDEAKTMYDLGEDQEKADILWKDLQAEKVDVEFYPFKYDLLASLKLNASRIAPLIDTIIKEE